MRTYVLKDSTNTKSALIQVFVHANNFALLCQVFVVLIILYNFSSLEDNKSNFLGSIAH